jgi:DNA-binding PadR family transcriptional regulator
MKTKEQELLEGILDKLESLEKKIQGLTDDGEQELVDYFDDWSSASASAPGANTKYGIPYKEPKEDKLDVILDKLEDLECRVKELEHPKRKLQTAAEKKEQTYFNSKIKPRMF